MTTKNTPPSQKMREDLLKAVLEDVVFDGWNQETIEKAAKRIGLEAGDIALAAPKGVTSLLEAWADMADAHTAATLQSTDLSNMRIREKIAFAVKTRIGFYSNNNKEAARRAAQAAAAPWRADLGPRLLWQAADTIWSALGDKSTDANWYSKRFVLSGVIGSTLSNWLAQDLDEEESATWDFLDDRIENVMQFEKFKADVNKVTAKMPNPLDILKYVPEKNPFDRNI